MYYLLDVTIKLTSETKVMLDSYQVSLKMNEKSLFI